MKPLERPILFSAPMVRALLAGTKTQTRRVVKPQPVDPFTDRALPAGARPVDLPRCPYGAPGDRLWVRETWGLSKLWDDESAESVRSAARHPKAHVRYPAGPGPAPTGKLRPSIHMPRSASRITLEVTGVRVERLQAITEADARAEGIERAADGYWHNYAPDGPTHQKASESYASLWESINSAGSWAANPWVWVVSFRRVAP